MIHANITPQKLFFILSLLVLPVVIKAEQQGLEEQLRKVIANKKAQIGIAVIIRDKAPKILASGRGEVAEKIIAKAKENDVPFYKDNKLAETLSKLEIGDAIPPELYEVVAEILVFVDDMDKMKAKLQQADMLS